VTLIHSVDSLRLAETISRIAIEEQCAPANILLEVNVSGEASKAGFSPGDIRKDIRKIRSLEGIKTIGLMTMAPFSTSKDEIRTVFSSLRKLCYDLADDLSGVELSMGMTNDYPIAVEEGATIIRVGSLIFTGK
jgi:uncharacterized pyridoxal phosphate-containing UPF0001 family protein